MCGLDGADALVLKLACEPRPDQSEHCNPCPQGHTTPGHLKGRAVRLVLGAGGTLAAGELCSTEYKPNVIKPAALVTRVCSPARR